VAKRQRVKVDGEYHPWDPEAYFILWVFNITNPGKCAYCGQRILRNLTWVVVDRCAEAYHVCHDCMTHWDEYGE
jgi:hypothetical protein